MKNSFSLNYRANCYSGCRKKKKKKKGRSSHRKKKKKKKKMKMKVDEVDPSREDDPRLKAKNSSS